MDFQLKFSLNAPLSCRDVLTRRKEHNCSWCSMEFFFPFYDFHSLKFLNQAYRYHLASKGHGYALEELAEKHTSQLRKMRKVQRDELRDEEDKWRKQSIKDYERTVST